MQGRKRIAKPALRHGISRQTGGGIWLYGLHAVRAALRNPARRCRRLLLTRDAQPTLGQDLPTGLPVEVVERGRIDQILPGAVHQGVALQVDPLPEPDLGEACFRAAGARNTVLVLDRVTDPQNVGAIFRSAAAFGARAVVTTDRHAPEITGTVAKAASGGVEAIPLVRVVNLARALQELADLGYWRIGLDANADRNLAGAAQGFKDVALVLGAEGEGLRRLTAENCDLLARLPIQTAVVDSLNVSNAAAVALYELARQE